jgi:chitinase
VGFYYLQWYPLTQLVGVVDWIVALTYDLHGQWDYGSPSAQTGCPAGNCLRSHSNWTETVWGLSMFTKAGFPSNQIVAGMPMYGRSFQMTTPGCYGPTCTFTGPNSGATPGKCTGTQGYVSNTEIYNTQWLQNGQFYDDGQFGDILVVNGTQFVSFLGFQNYEIRKTGYKNGGFLGIVDWVSESDAWYS